MRLANKASADLVRAFEYSQRHFGQRQAIAYVEALRARVMSLPMSPFAGRPAEGNANLRKLIFRSHAIHYRVEASEIIILRIPDVRRRDAHRT